jgi:hypothetical protein
LILPVGALVSWSVSAPTRTRMQRLLMLISMTCACALQRAYVVQPRGGLPSMSVDPSFWQAKQARARYQMEKETSLLDELMEREQILMEQLFTAQQGGVVAAATAADPNLQLELEQALTALAASEQQREIDVQKTGAYWLEKVKDLRGKLGAEAAPAAVDPSLQLELEQALTALAASEQQREVDVQKTAAYWLSEVATLRGRLGAAEAGVEAASSATEAAAAVAWQEGVEAAAAEAARSEQ